VIYEKIRHAREYHDEQSDMMEKIRLSKVMAQRGLCSRREADRYIEQGLVLVAGKRVSTLGTRIDPCLEITLCEEAQRRQDAQVTILLNKPIGFVSSQPEDGYKPAVSLISEKTHFNGDESTRRFHPAQLRGLAPAGRLDIDSTGVLILTQNGRIARKLIGENSSIEKEYLVRVRGHLTEDDLKLLNHGLSLDGKTLKPAKVVWQNEDQLRFVLREGKKRQIRRMCELVGLNAVGLKRVRVGKVMLGKLPLGEWRYLGVNEEF